MTHGLLDWMDRGSARLPWVVDRAVDRRVAEVADAHDDFLFDDMKRALVVSRRCQSCGAVCSSFGAVHRDGCDLDRTVSASIRWQRRNPERYLQIHRRGNRLRKLRARWAVLNGRCGACIDAPAVAGLSTCERCRAYQSERSRASYARHLEERTAV